LEETPNPMKPIRNLVVAIFATLIVSITVYAGDPTGTWKFGGEGPNGRSVDTTLVLKWQDNQLSGTVDNRAGKVAITNATFADDRVTFTVVRELGRGFRKQKITINYSGKLEGDTIKGTIETTGREKKPVSLSWEATRLK
jgi:hypothetical protein